MRRVAVKTAYQGKDFHGSQIQPGKRTVEGDILSDLSLIHKRDGEWFDLRMAGRTDRGVNALGNVAVFNTDFKDNGELLNALNAVSHGVFYRSAADVDGGFNPRHAEERVYRYIMPSDGIDVRKAKECASMFVGEHDFSRFSRTDERSPVVNMRGIEVCEAGDCIAVEFRADHFLWNMIRRIVPAIAAVGKGDSSPADVQRALDGEDISFGLARPDALTLCDVVYAGVSFRPAGPLGGRLEEKLFSLGLETEFYNRLKR